MFWCFLLLPLQSSTSNRSWRRDIDLAGKLERTWEQRGLVPHSSRRPGKGQPQRDPAPQRGRRAEEEKGGRDAVFPSRKHLPHLCSGPSKLQRHWTGVHKQWGGRGSGGHNRIRRGLGARNMPWHHCDMLVTQDRSEKCSWSDARGWVTVAKAQVPHGILAFSKTEWETWSKIKGSHQNVGAGSIPGRPWNFLKWTETTFVTIRKTHYKWKFSSVFKSTTEFNLAHLISQPEICVPAHSQKQVYAPLFTHENIQGMA